MSEKYEWEKDLLDPPKNVPYFIPKQPRPTGTVKNIDELKQEDIPELFKPLKIKNLTSPNRIGVSPMCMYSSKDGFPTKFHSTHYGYLAMKGPGAIVVESTGVSPKGRITPQCTGMWTDEHALAFKEIVDFVHSQDKIIGIQLNHSGRNGSTAPLYYPGYNNPLRNELGGWLDEVYGPSNGDPNSPSELWRLTKELSKESIHEIIEQFGDAAKRAIEISGFDFVEIHGAHGYLINQFLSASSNHRTDEYGGSFENRIRFLLEIIKNVKSKIPDSIPVWFRISASENNDDDPNAWRLDDSVKLAPILVEHGIDLIDVSSGGNSVARSGKHVKQIEMAKILKDSVKDTCLIAAVGYINTSELAESLLKDKACDICLVGKTFLKTPELAETWATELGVDTQRSIQWAWPYGNAF